MYSYKKNSHYKIIFTDNKPHPVKIASVPGLIIEPSLAIVIGLAVFASN